MLLMCMCAAVVASVGAKVEIDATAPSQVSLTLEANTHTPRHVDPRPWMDSTLPVSKRVDLLLPAMTLVEKLSQLNRPDSVNAALFESGVGLLMHSTYCCGVNVTDTVRRRNDLQRQFLSTGVGLRLGIPASWRSFINHGAVAFGVTFPEAVGLGSTWDTALVAEVAAANAATARALGLDMEWYVMNLFTDPRFGRTEEGYSEEPMLTAAMVAATTNGSHGVYGLADDAYMPPDKVSCNWKHCCGYGAPSGGQNGGPTMSDEHTVREVFVKPWRRAREAGARGVMPSHQTLLGTPCHSNEWLLNGVLRSELGWDLAYVLSDTADVAKLTEFRVATDGVDAAAKALLAGVDVAQVDPCFTPLVEAMARGLVNESSVDAAARRVLSHKFSAGLFDRPYVDESVAAGLVDSPAHIDLAYRAAVGGIVLLKNDHGVLPLKRDKSLTVAVIGPNAGCTSDTTLRWNEKTTRDDGAAGGAGGGGLCDAQINYLGNYESTVPPASGVWTVHSALVAAGYAKSVTLSRGAEIDSLSTALVADAVAAARAADVVVAVVGDSASSCGEGDDRDSLDPAGSQLELLQALATVGKPLVVVVVGCRAVTFGPNNILLSNISALLMAWRPGSEGGRAVVDLLFGAAEPSGRLGQNWLRSPSQVGSCANPWFQQRRSDVTSSDGVDGAEGRRYASYTHSNQPSTPLFHFGFGLSLAKHALSELVASVQWPVTPGGRAVMVVLAWVTLTETSGRTAPAVIQLYAQDPVGVLHRARPWKRLVGFGKHTVAGGGSMRVTIPILLDDLAFPGDDMAMALHAGNYTLSVGFSSDGDAGLTTTVVIPETIVLQSRVIRP